MSSCAKRWKREMESMCAVYMDKGRRKSSMGLIYILKFLKKIGLFLSLHNIVGCRIL